MQCLRFFRWNRMHSRHLKIFKNFFIEMFCNKAFFLVTRLPFPRLWPVVRVAPVPPLIQGLPRVEHALSGRRNGSPSPGQSRVREDRPRILFSAQRRRNEHAFHFHNAVGKRLEARIRGIRRPAGNPRGRNIAEWYMNEEPIFSPYCAQDPVPAHASTQQQPGSPLQRVKVSIAQCSFNDVSSLMIRSGAFSPRLGR
jgi:hypothetical protein